MIFVALGPREIVMGAGHFRTGALSGIYINVQ